MLCGMPPSREQRSGTLRGHRRQLLLDAVLPRMMCLPAIPLMKKYKDEIDTIQTTFSSCRPVVMVDCLPVAAKVRAALARLDSSILGTDLVTLQLDGVAYLASRVGLGHQLEGLLRQCLQEGEALAPRLLLLGPADLSLLPLSASPPAVAEVLGAVQEKLEAASTQGPREAVNLEPVLEGQRCGDSPPWIVRAARVPHLAGLDVIPLPMAAQAPPPDPERPPARISSGVPLAC